MTDIEMALVCFINEYHRRVIYRNEKYQMLHGVKYRREFDLEYTQKIRSKHNSNCFEAAYELKTYYAENGILSNTIVLKMRPESPEIQEYTTIKVRNNQTHFIATCKNRIINTHIVLYQFHLVRT